MMTRKSFFRNIDIGSLVSASSDPGDPSSAFEDCRFVRIFCRKPRSWILASHKCLGCNSCAPNDARGDIFWYWWWRSWNSSHSMCHKILTNSCCMLDTGLDPLKLSRHRQPSSDASCKAFVVFSAPLLHLQTPQPPVAAQLQLWMFELNTRVPCTPKNVRFEQFMKSNGVWFSPQLSQRSTDKLDTTTTAFQGQKRLKLSQFLLPPSLLPSWLAISSLDSAVLLSSSSACFLSLSLVPFQNKFQFNTNVNKQKTTKFLNFSENFRCSRLRFVVRHKVVVTVKFKRKCKINLKQLKLTKK